MSAVAARVFLFGLLPIVLAAAHVRLDERVVQRAQRLEVAFANLALGILAILAMDRRDGFRDATVIAVAILAGGATITHVTDIVETGNLAAGNTVQNVDNLLTPAVLIWLLLAMRRSAGGNAEEAALLGPWRDTAASAAAQATAVVSVAFSLGYAVDQPALGSRATRRRGDHMSVFRRTG